MYTQTRPVELPGCSPPGTVTGVSSVQITGEGSAEDCCSPGSRSVTGAAVRDADVRGMIQAGLPGGAGGPGSWRRRAEKRGGRGGFGGELGEVEEVALVRVVESALAARAEDVAAEQGQGLGQLGVLL